MASFFKKPLFLLAGFALTASTLYSDEETESPPSVLVIGHGFMGSNHVKNLEILQKENRVRIVGIVDIDEKKLKNLPYPTFKDSEEACKALAPDIVVNATNTAAHYEVSQIVLNSFQRQRPPALFIEKPLVETSQQALQLASQLQEFGYGNHLPIACGYLFRNSPIVNKAIDHIKTHALRIEEIEVRWQKKRVPSRPSAGVHIDEATHPVDLILNRILPALKLPSTPLSLICLSRQYDDSIIDIEQQRHLYPNLPEMLIPLAQVVFEIRTPTIPIHVFSSFIQPPQIREILLKCSNGAQLAMNFDIEQNDRLEVRTPLREASVFIAEKPNKLLIEWRDFLEYYHSSNATDSLASLADMVNDIHITELLNTIPLQQECPVESPFP
ncbi:MAG: Gfo/Idh/MocA family oxidoreductase [Verrucomicrobia bacterium]|nr:Gfo/Idh/MocA family oxidoreductase [Verrucomicrobiota bacterium]